MLPRALSSGAVLLAAMGNLTEARSMAEEANAVTAATGPRRAPYGSLAVAAWAGCEADLTELVGSTTDEMIVHGEGQWLTAADWATAVLNNGLGRYHEALMAAERATEESGDVGWSAWSMAEVAEAAARMGSRDCAGAAVRRLGEIARACGSDWAIGIAARSRALLSEGEIAEDLYGEAIERLGRTGIRAELARSHLLYGEWLRRQHRRVDARGHLRIAYDLLAAMGSAGFAERARRELLATGETVRKRTVDTRDELTPQEIEIARLAGEGRTNPEIGAELFISPRTVEWHLRKVFGKLGVRSRKELRPALAHVKQAGLEA